MDLEEELNKGIELSESGKNQEAIELFDNVLKLDSNNVDALLNKGIALNDSEDYENAMECLDKVLKLDPDNIDARNIKGYSLRNSGENNKAILLLNEALKLDPEFIYALVNRGSAYFNLNNYKEALNDFNGVLNRDKDNILALFCKGETLYGLNKFKEALTCFERVLSFEPEDIESLNYKGILLVQLGEIKEGIKIYEKGIKIDPNFDLLWFNKGLALKELNKLKDSLECFEKAIKIDEDYYWAWYEKGNILNRLGREKSAIDAYKTFVEIVEQNNLSDADLIARRVKAHIKRGPKNRTVSFSPSNKPQYWQWVTKSLYFLETDGNERGALEPEYDADPGGWWTCHKDTKVGDLILLYRAGKGNGRTYQDIKYLIQATSDAYPISDDEYAFEHGWEYGCDYKPLFKFKNSITYHEIDKDPYLNEWNAYRGHFQRSVYKTDEKHWKIVNDILSKKNKEYANFLKTFKSGEIVKDILTEKDFENELAKNIRVLNEFGYDIEVESQQEICKGQGGFIDLLCKNKSDDSYVVIELKIVRANRNTFGQISDYMGWVMDRKANGKSVKGLVISRGYDNSFKSALRTNGNIDHVELSDVLSELGLKLK